MTSSVFSVISTFFDLLALITCLGSLGCRLLLVPSSLLDSDPIAVETLLGRLWRLLTICIVGLTASSISELALRTAQMSGRPIADISPLLLTTLSQTHYGHVWLVRLTALTILWICWRIGKNRSQSYAVSAFMFGAGTIIAVTRSASGHAADGGDLTLPEFMDWLHLMAVSAWGGGLIALSTVVLPTAIAHLDRGRTLIGDISRRFSVLAGIALGTLTGTAMFNAWLQVGSLQALLNTAYGMAVIIKLLLLLVLVSLGASNRYTSVPLLQQWAGRPMTGRGFFYDRVVMWRLTAVGDKLVGAPVARWFMYKVRAEAALIIAALICTAFLLHSVPAHHFSHVSHEDASQKPNHHHMHHPMPME